MRPEGTLPSAEGDAHGPKRGGCDCIIALSSASQLASSEVIADSTICPMHAYALLTIGRAACRIVRRVVQEASGDRVRGWRL